MLLTQERFDDRAVRAVLRQNVAGRGRHARVAAQRVTRRRSTLLPRAQRVRHAARRQRRRLHANISAAAAGADQQRRGADCHRRRQRQRRGVQHGGGRAHDRRRHSSISTNVRICRLALDNARLSD